MLAHSTTKLRNQKDLELNVIKCCSDISHVSHLIANEPSMALFRVEQHVQKTIPQTTKFSGMTRKSDEMLKGRIYDANYAKEAVISITKSNKNFQNIEDLLRKSTSIAAVIKMKKEQKPKLL